MRTLIVGLIGAMRSIFGIRLLEALNKSNIESHVKMLNWAERTIKPGTRHRPDGVTSLANVNYNVNDLNAAVSSGSFLTEGTNSIPCSMGALGGIAHGYGTHLIYRAADVALKNRWRLVLMPTKTPLSELHIENMLKLPRIGVTMLPPMPTFYNHPSLIEDIVDHIVTRVHNEFRYCHTTRQTSG